MATPLGVERRLRVDSARIVERVVVPWSAPHALFQWTAEEPAELLLTWRIDLKRPPSSAARAAGEADAAAPGRLRWRHDERRLLVTDGAYSVLYALSAPAQWSVTATEGDSACQVRLRHLLERGQNVRLVLVGGGAEVAPRSVRAAGRAVVAVRGRGGRLRQVLEQGLSIEASDEQVGPALAAARLRLSSRLVELPQGGRCLVAGYGSLDRGEWRVEARAPETLIASMASLAAGDFEAARDTLAFLGERLDSNGQVPSLCTLTGQVSYEGDDATLLYLLLVSRYLAWTGDLPTVQAQWPRVMHAFSHAERRVVGSGDLWDAAVEGLAVAAESVGENPAAVRAARSESSGKPGASARQLAAGVTGDPDTVLRLVEGVLGAEPDAPKGRLVLRPRPPSEWTFLNVRALRVGEAAVRMDYEREGRRHKFVLSQERGSAPLQLILEPELPGLLESAVVDGVTAELDPRPAGGRSRVPVQLALDHARTLQLEMGA